jgi:signal transduction histidine kinase
MDQGVNVAALRAGHLLVVDDSDAVREVLAIKLRREGYSVSEAATGGSALECMAGGGVDLIMLDLQLPDMSGLQVIRQLRQSRSMLDVPIIVVSGMSDPSDVVAALHGGANDYVTKPFDLTVALARIRTQLAARQLKQANDRFLRVASHDLKKPLLVMLDVARQLRQACAPGAVHTDDAQTSLDFLIDSGRYMQDMIESLLGLSMLQAGRLRLLPMPTDLGAVVRQAVARNRVYAERKEITLGMQFERDLPNIVADDSRIMQVLENLIGNAIKFGPPGTRIDIRARPDAGGVLCEVIDNGPGIPEEETGRLFTEFCSLTNRPTGNEKSSGLGLSICRELIQLHGGQIGARNNPGGGATFWFRLPLEAKQ